jgi:A/G-specific adenine glycosylase
MLGGMASLPGPQWGEEETTATSLAVVSQGFTHFTLDLHVASRSAPPAGDGWWQPLDAITEAGLPTLYARAVEAVLSRKEALAA